MLNIRAGLECIVLKTLFQVLWEQRTNVHILDLAGVDSWGVRAASEPILTATVGKGNWLSAEALPSNQPAEGTFVL